MPTFTAVGPHWRPREKAVCWVARLEEESLSQLPVRVSGAGAESVEAAEAEAEKSEFAEVTEEEEEEGGEESCCSFRGRASGGYSKCAWGG